MIWGKVVSFTDRGAEVGRRIAALMPDDRIELYARGTDPSVRGTILTRMVQQAMVDCSLLIFVGATGIAVRSIAPYLQGKAYDPAVIVVDENARFVISLVSGHLGGANALAQRLADGLGAQAVITTATDGRGMFAVDTWAKEHGCTVMETGQIQYISAALLRGEAVGVQSDYPVDGALPHYLRLNGAADSGFTIARHAHAQPFAHTLHLIPRIVHLGIGCRKGIAQEAIERAVCAALTEAEVDFAAVRGVSSIDVKKNEAGLCGFCAEHGLPFTTYTADELLAVEGEFSASEFVKKTVGVDNVCERAAVKDAGGKLIARRRVQDGVTVALAEENWRVSF
ncbi:MAG: cobalt-precorrin 5A hydrolase [Butyricicoccus sp.]|nr:cobalt-precorrin 5A hydrolase [Butyricicoccus sp.]